MNRQKFNEWLQAKDACSDAVEWCDQHPELSVKELLNICPRGEWILWLYTEAGYAPEVLAPVAYRAATRAMAYAADALDRAGVQHQLRGLVITDAKSAQAAELAARAARAAEWAVRAERDAARAAEAAEAAEAAVWAARAARAAVWAAEAAVWAAEAEHKLCADDCREMLPVWEVGND